MENILEKIGLSPIMILIVIVIIFLLKEVWSIVRATRNDWTNDSKNDNYIVAINWLNKNLKNIYPDFYERWEFQIGLCKEFLQISYRFNSIPSSKRVLALYAAYNCILIANDELENKKTKKKQEKIV